VLGLSACTPKTGAAAVVGGKRITEHDVLTNAAGADRSFSGTVITQTLVKQELYTQFLAKNGGVPSDSQLAKARSAAIGILSQNQANSGSDAQIAQFVSENGMKPSFGPTFLRAYELEAYAGTAIKAASLRALITAVQAAKISVSVAPAYGSWDPSTQDLKLTTNPDFLVPSPTPSATAGN
jgi:hypothetical protein